MAGFDANRSMVNEDALAAFLASPITGNITEVPGIGDGAKRLLARSFGNESSVTTTYQLIGKFLTLRKAGMSQQDHLDAMWHWLKDRNINAFRSGIVLCVAEKCNLMIPGIYSADAEPMSCTII
ncbi:Hypothetical Protein FCC1311_023032 [Hondaea fermentalgiana]|uniref:Uncharacterized protein n=1 Tax=Hondaea fermentalgiana TaxID=2315210 RepID=A0A2R5GBY0_9STRA|nr:Hypothetical Protein FCC1311_023032 [Hondaea fermentalgiana]|eukprot:GBG26083.1 Hypothetical Protein FCC1311_023032 [Hondaea fermentalgiana]